MQIYLTMTYRKHHILLLLAFVCHLLPAQKAKFVCPTMGSVIKVVNKEVVENYTRPVLNSGITLNGNIEWEQFQNYDGKTDTSFVGIDSGYYKVKTEYSLMLVEKPGYKTHTELVYTSGFNVNKKRFVLKPLQPLLRRQKNQTYLIPKKVIFDVPSKKFRQKYYESYADYLKGNEEHEYVSGREIYVNNSVLTETLEDYLKLTGFEEKNPSLSLNITGEIELLITINAITEHKFNRYCLVELNLDVKLRQSSIVLAERKYTTRSNVGYDFSGENEMQNKTQLADALNQVLELVVKDPANSSFISPEGEQKKAVRWKDTLTIKNTLASPVNLENSTNAVITVIQKDWHGSGCVISSDGYIVTNYHVVGLDTAEVFVVFNSGAKKRCVFIRGNAEYDLSLLKVDSTFQNPIKINPSKAINVGADVYAIGTPSDIKLGQSITKGIVSGKRNLDGKIFIQSDVSVNKGNSGGALTNKEGELIGVVNSKLMGFGVEGVGFAIPAFYLEEALMLKISH